jgi:iron complex outermembrane receptor protein
LSARLPGSESVTKLEDFVSPHIVSGTDQRVGDNMRYRRCGRTRSALLALVLSGVLSSAAVAQQKLNFDIPAQPAAAAIQSWAQQSGLQVFAAEDDLRGIRTNAVQGDFAPVEAAQRLIAGTGLEVVATGENTVTIRRVRPVGTAASSGDEKFSNSVEPLMEVIVTGSRIRRPGYDTLQATVVTDSKELEKRAYTNLGQALQNTPGFMLSDASALSSTQGTQTVGQTFVNFFGLGSQRTLTLVNGRRYVSSNTASGRSSVAAGSQVDINLLPAGLTERIETVAIGGAPVYGSDAIAGTVNVILRDDFEGIQGSAIYGMTEEEDAETETYRLLMGGNFAQGRGNAVLSVEHNEQKGLLLSERFGFGQMVTNPLNTGPNDGIPAQVGIDDLRFGILTDGGLPVDVRVPGANLSGIVVPGVYPRGNYVFDASGTPLQFGPNGDLVPYRLGTATTSVLGAPFQMDGGDGMSGADHVPLLAPTKRTLVNALAHYDIAESVRLFAETSFGHTEGVEESELIALVEPVLFRGPQIVLSATNPFLSQQARDVLAANGMTQFQINRNLSDLLERIPGTTTLDVYRIVSGLEGDFGAFGESWSWDISYNYGRSENVSTLPFIDRTRLLEAVQATTDANGRIVCVSGNPDCAPLNLFGENNFSAAAADYVTDISRGVSLNTMQVVSANLSGNLPFGISDPIAFSLGVEHRKETAEFTPDLLQENGVLLTGGGFGFEGISGEFETDEAYTELLVPVISPEQDLPVVKSFSVEGAVRYVDHSLTGAATTWSGGMRFAPRLPGFGDGLMFRGVFTHAIRSPAVTELFTGRSPLATGLVDVCSFQNFNRGLNPTVREANCTAALAAVGAGSPSSFNETTDIASITGSTAGNPNLDNEEADSWSVGIVYQPASLPQFRFAADWSEIELEGGIQTLSLSQLMAACYDSPSFPNVPACTNFHRLTAAEAAAQPGPARIAGDVANGFVTGYVNTTKIQFSGLIATGSYVFDLPRELGALNFGTQLYYIDEFKTETFAGTVVTNTAGTNTAPRNRVNFDIGYSVKQVDLGVQARWTDGVLTGRGITIEDTEFLEIPSYTIFSGNVGYRFSDKVSLMLTVDNLLDKEIPDPARISRAIGLYDALGRRYFATVRASF